MKQATNRKEAKKSLKTGADSCSPVLFPGAVSPAVPRGLLYVSPFALFCVLFTQKPLRLHQLQKLCLRELYAKDFAVELFAKDFAVELSAKDFSVELFEKVLSVELFEKKKLGERIN